MMTKRRMTGALLGALALGVMGCTDAGANPVEEQEVVAMQAAQHGRGHDRCRRPPADVPAALAVPADECLSVQATGIGVQIYSCVAGAWVNKAPEANLVDDHGRFQGNHFLGPSWQWRDGSKVKAAKVAASAGADPTHDVPWLLLAVTSEDGEGRLADVKHVQRLHTGGGAAPAGACTEGPEIRVPYTADYLFYHLRPTDDE
jgi:hypothetical protein